MLRWNKKAIKHVLALHAQSVTIVVFVLKEKWYNVELKIYSISNLLKEYSVTLSIHYLE